MKVSLTVSECMDILGAVHSLKNTTKKDFAENALPTLLENYQRLSEAAAAAINLQRQATMQNAERQEYQQQHGLLLAKHASRKPDGSIDKVQGPEGKVGYNIADVDAFTKDKNELNARFADLLEKTKRLHEAFSQEMLKQVEVDILPLNLADFADSAKFIVMLRLRKLINTK